MNKGQSCLQNVLQFQSLGTLWATSGMLGNPRLNPILIPEGVMGEARTGLPDSELVALPSEVDEPLVDDWLLARLRHSLNWE